MANTKSSKKFSKKVVAKVSKKQKSKSQNWLSHKGKLEGRGYLNKKQDRRRQILKSCVHRHGYRSCLGSLTALKRNRKTRNKYKAQLESNSTHLSKSYGGIGSYGPQNPYKKNCKLIKKKTSRKTNLDKSLKRTKYYRRNR